VPACDIICCGLYERSVGASLTAPSIGPGMLGAGSNSRHVVGRNPYEWRG
jgi:hypothetical protein